MPTELRDFGIFSDMNSEASDPCQDSIDDPAAVKNSFENTEASEPGQDAIGNLASVKETFKQSCKIVTQFLRQSCTALWFVAKWHSATSRYQNQTQNIMELKLIMMLIGALMLKILSVMELKLCNMNTKEIVKALQ